jgi:hypothetical protein
MKLNAISTIIKKAAYESARLNLQIFKNQKAIVTLYPTSKSRGNVLLSYILRPMRMSDREIDTSTHSNVWSCREIALTWNDLGYTVDVIDFDNIDFVPLKRYDFFIDIHSNIERLAPMLGDHCVRVLHVTGAHWIFQNAAEYRRLYDIQRKKGVTLYPVRLSLPSRAIEYADHVSIVGNSFTESTFNYSGKPTVLLHNPTTVEFPPLERDFSRCKKSFLWLGSNGLALRGLDLVLEAFSEMPDCSLTVCGPIDREKDFEAAYYEELYEMPNIRTLGTVPVNSTQFVGLATECVGMVYPSSSEGQAGSVITCMHAGLIPLISRESGVDLGEGGIILEDISSDSIKKGVRMINNMCGDELARRSQVTRNYARNYYNREVFSQEYRQFVASIVSSGKHQGGGRRDR